jgi:DNA-binding NarL/FixJ family response regulator
LADSSVRVPVAKASALTPAEHIGLSHEAGRGPFLAAVAESDSFIAVIEGRTFLRECVRRSVQAAFPLPIKSYSTVVELERQHAGTSPALIILSHVDDSGEANALKILSEVVPTAPVIVLAYKNDSELAKTAIFHGAKGYIPVTMGFEIAIEAVRFVLAGGTYVPVDCLLARNWTAEQPALHPPTSGAVTARELSVVRAIQQGKSNKVIGYELNMCESTVKVHMRRIMKKLKAKNRTEVAIKAGELLRCARCVRQNECWSAGRCANLAFKEAG